MSNFPSLKQKEIIEDLTGSNIVIIACAGSGKSTTIIAKAQYTVSNSSTWKSICIITYTNKSCDDLRKKLKHDKKRISVETFHAFLIKEVLCFSELFKDRQVGFDYSQARTVATLEKWKIGVSRDSLCCSPVPSQRGTDFVFEFALELLKKTNVQNYLRFKYQAIYIDEAQDNNILQYELVNKFIDLGIQCVLVGDPSQTIFGFRGASKELFINLSRNQKFKSIRLDKNYRCHEYISDLANSYSFPRALKKNEDGGYFVIATNQVTKVLMHERIKQVTIFRYKNADLDTYGDSVKIIKRPIILDNLSGCNTHAINNLLRLIAVADYNEYDFLQDEFGIDFSSKNLKGLNKLLRNIKYNNSLDSLREFNSAYLVAEENKLTLIYEESLKQDVKDYYLSDLFDKTTMTIHGSKGLEFDNVVIFKSDFNSLRKESDRNNFYVAVTRARHRLYIVDDEVVI